MFVGINQYNKIMTLKTNKSRETKDIFLTQCPNNKRDKATLEKLIQENVEVGTNIFTDGWSAYKD